jgi:hypothetical protein
MINPGAKFCPACGNALPPEPVLPPANRPFTAGAAREPLPGYAPPAGLPGTPAAAPLAAAPKSTNGLAIASMVLGIVWVWWVGSILALIFGYVAKGQIRDANGAQGGGGMAIAGIVLGWVGIGTLCLCIVAAAIGH